MVFTITSQKSFIPCKCKVKVGCSNHHMNTFFPSAKQPDKSLPGKGFWTENRSLGWISGEDFSRLLKVAQIV